MTITVVVTNSVLFYFTCNLLQMCNYIEIEVGYINAISLQFVRILRGG